MNPGFSLLFLLFTSSLMCLAILGSMRRAKVPGLSQWLRAGWASFAALGMLATREHTPALIGIITANALLGCSIIWLLQGCRRFFGRSPAMTHAWLALGAMMAAIVYGTYIEPDLNLRIAVFSLFNVYIFTSIARLIRTAGRRATWRYSYRFALLTCLTAIVGHSLRGLLYGLEIVQQTSMLDKGVVNTIFLSLGVPFMAFFAIGMVLLSHDRLIDRLEKLADIDELTGVLRRRTFLSRAAAEMQGARREGSPLALVLLDIDHFKSVNDTYGHAAGDTVLEQFARTLALGIRATDLVGRVGGEEFAILCRNTTLAQAAALMERLRQSVAEQPTLIDGRDIFSTFSAGVAAMRPEDTLANLMARADAVQYAAKAAGRDRIFLADDYSGAPDATASAHMASIEASGMMTGH